MSLKTKPPVAFLVPLSHCAPDLPGFWVASLLAWVTGTAYIDLSSDDILWPISQNLLN